MPLENYFLMSSKDVFVTQLGATMKGVESLSSNSPMVYVVFTTIIDREKFPCFIGASANCLDKLHLKMKLKNIEHSEDNIYLKRFLVETSSLLIKRMRHYVAISDERNISIGGAKACENKGETSYQITRNFLIDGEDMEASY